MKALLILFIFLFLNSHITFSQDYELVGLIENKIVTIDENTGETTLLLEIQSIPDGTVLRDLVYQESKQEFYTIANPTDNPYIAKISPSGEFDKLKNLETEFATIYTVEAISLFNKEIYFSASLNGGPDDNDPHAESLLKVNAENEIELLTGINTEKPFPDIDVLNVTEDRIFIFDGAPPGQNFLEFYEMENNNIESISQPNNIYTSNYMPIADFCYFNNELLFIVHRSLYLFDRSIKKVIDINANGFNSNENFNGLTQHPSCLLPSTDLEEEITVCNQDFIILDVENPNSSYLWSDGSTEPNLNVTESGPYEVEITNSCGSKKFKTEVKFEQEPNIEWKEDIQLCNINSLEINAGYPNSNYLWSDGSTDSTLTVTESGVYEVEITNPCGSKKYKTEIKFEEDPNIDWEEEIQLCNINSIELNAGYPNSSYLWSDGSTDSTLTVTENGEYEVEITNACGSKKYKTEIKFEEDPNIDWEEEIQLCNINSIELNAKFPNSNYLWSDGSTNSTLIVTESGEYEVKISNACGSRKYKTKVLLQYPPQDSNIQVDAINCDSYSLSPTNYNKDNTYLWQNNKEDSVFTATNSGWYKLKASNECGATTDSVYVEIVDFSDILLPNIITPNGDKKNDKFVIDERLQNVAISIFNRYGKLVYQNPRYLNDWDSGNLNSGNYFYQITLDCGDIYKGWIEVRK